MSSHGAVSAIGTCVSYDGSGFEEFPTVSKERQHHAASIRVSASKPASLID